MDEIKTYYEQDFSAESGMPPFSHLSQRQRDKIEKSLGFALWRLGNRVNRLKEVIKRMLT